MDSLFKKWGSGKIMMVERFNTKHLDELIKYIPQITNYTEFEINTYGLNFKNSLDHLKVIRKNLDDGYLDTVLVVDFLSIHYFGYLSYSSLSSKVRNTLAFGLYRIFEIKDQYVHIFIQLCKDLNLKYDLYSEFVDDLNSERTIGNLIYNINHGSIFTWVEIEHQSCYDIDPNADKGIYCFANELNTPIKVAERTEAISRYIRYQTTKMLYMIINKLPNSDNIIPLIDQYALMIPIEDILVDDIKTEFSIESYDDEDDELIKHPITTLNNISKEMDYNIEFTEYIMEDNYNASIDKKKHRNKMEVKIPRNNRYELDKKYFNNKLDTYSNKKYYFEKFFCYVGSTDRYYYTRCKFYIDFEKHTRTPYGLEIKEYKRSVLKNEFKILDDSEGNLFVKRWISDMNTRNYESITFSPYSGKLVEIDEIFNTFRGYPKTNLDIVDYNIKPLIKEIKSQIGKLFLYLMAHKIRKPASDLPAGVMGIKLIGKGNIMELFTKMVGQHYCYKSSREEDFTTMKPTGEFGKIILEVDCDLKSEIKMASNINLGCNPVKYALVVCTGSVPNIENWVIFNNITVPDITIDMVSKLYFYITGLDIDNYDYESNIKENRSSELFRELKELPDVIQFLYDIYADEESTDDKVIDLFNQNGNSSLTLEYKKWLGEDKATIGDCKKLKVEFSKFIETGLPLKFIKNRTGKIILKLNPQLLHQYITQIYM